MAQRKIAAPGFILMEEMQRDMRGTLIRLGEMGYDGIELLGFFGHSAENIRAWCKEAGLIPFGCFIRLEELLQLPGAQEESPFNLAVQMPGDTPESKLSYVREIGCESVSVLLSDDNIYSPDLPGHLSRFCGLCHGFSLAAQYHNHAQEYRRRQGENYLMDEILEKTPDILFEPDLGWMEIGLCRPEGQLKRHRDRIRCIHMKDYFRPAWDGSMEHLFRPTGYGVMDWARLLPLCEELDPQWYVCDHDKAYGGDVFGELKLSLDFLRSALRFC